MTSQELISIVESSIKSLVDTFLETPYFFYTENDLHCHLYHGIYSKLPIEKWQCITGDGRSSILLHKEYPTKERYNAKELRENVPKGARGHFDLSIWNPEKTREKFFRVRRSVDFNREQHTFIAIEFDLIEENDSLNQAIHHLKWDLLKLKSEKNKIEHGYLLVFVRDWIHRSRFLKKVKDEVVKEHEIAVLYVESSEDRKLFGTLSQKSFLNYERVL